MGNRRAQRFGASPWIYRQWEGLPGHEGVDLRAAAGAPVYAGADGEVVAVDDAHPQSTLEYPYGCQVRIRHCCGQDVYHVIYGHLAEVAVHPGQWVSRGERIGATHEGDDDLGPAGCNLHLTLLREGARTDGYAPNLVDPELYLVRPDGWRPVADADLPTIYGTFRDENQEMARLMRGAGVNGYILWSEAVGSGGDVVRAGRDYVASTGAFGHTPIVRLSYGEEPDGALPTADGVGDFAARCADWVRQSQGCRVWIIGNEPNGPRAHPLDEPITAGIVSAGSAGARAAGANAPSRASISGAACRSLTRWLIACRSVGGADRALPLVASSGPASAGAWVEVEEERLLVCRVGELLEIHRSLSLSKGDSGTVREPPRLES